MHDCLFRMTCTSLISWFDNYIIILVQRFNYFVFFLGKIFLLWLSIFLPMQVLFNGVEH